jgi:hypothetical protein
MTAKVGGGNRTFGNLVIFWTPSDTSSAVTFRFLIGGALGDEFTLNNDNRSRPFLIKSNQDVYKGKLELVYNPDGKSGRITCSLEWEIDGSSNSFQGLLGTF